MTVPHRPASRVQELTWLAHASLQGELGILAGTGLSRAATNNQAPTFTELLEQLAKRLSLPCNFTAPPYSCKSLPQVASQLLSDFSAANQDKKDPAQRFREIIAQICHLVPTPIVQERLAKRLTEVKPAWIITTNYDHIIESLLESSLTVPPNQPFTANTERVPVYHLHGTRQRPATIKITEEDYVALLGPIDYQRLKLPLLFTESTTLVLGYALGDINVRAAMAWAESFSTERDLQRDPWQGRIVQALYKQTPLEAPYSGPNGEIIIEIQDIPSFLDELSTVRGEMQTSLQNLRHDVKTFLSNPDKPADISADPSTYNDFLAIVGAAKGLCETSALVTFIDSALSSIWQRAIQPNQFSFYNKYLSLLLDILECLTVEACPPALLSYLAEALERVAPYIVPDKPRGTAHLATETWWQHHRKVSEPLKEELWSYSAQYNHESLKRILELVAPSLSC